MAIKLFIPNYLIKETTVIFWPRNTVRKIMECLGTSRIKNDGIAPIFSIFAVNCKVRVFFKE